ncbi:MAG: hypothetical protein QOF14_821 [Hyphomicrobiales bacterium]|jgi:hypothetical protein|nr:hypothetical protein [Hyphomicrobiales bacterium]
MLPGTKLVVPAERSESRDPWRLHSDDLTLGLYGSRIAAGAAHRAGPSGPGPLGGFRDDNRAKS